MQHLRFSIVLWFCAAFSLTAGKLFNVDITEIDIDGLRANGVTISQAAELVFGYVLRLNEAVTRDLEAMEVGRFVEDAEEPAGAVGVGENV